MAGYAVGGVDGRAKMKGIFSLAISARGAERWGYK